MPKKVHMEALSPTMEEGQLVNWLKSEGDEVEEGDVLAEIETDKATMELVARASGVLREHFIDEGGTAPVGTVIGVIAGADEDISDIATEAPSPAVGAEGEPQAPTEREEPGEPEEKGVTEGAQPGPEPEFAEEGPGPAAPARAPEPPTEQPQPQAPTGGDGRIKASPLARRLADEAGLELRRVDGSGPAGRITKRDIEQAIERGERAPAPAAPGAEERPEVEEVPVSQMRKTIASRLETSIGPVPTFYLTREVDTGRLLDARERVNERLADEDGKASLNDFLIKATAVALREHPEVNASWDGDVIRRYGRVHIGVAVAIEEGLITPVIRDADRKRVREIAREVKELAGRAREKRLEPDEYQGATFSVSNLGMFGIEEFTAIINPPEAGILAVGRSEEKPVAEDGELVVRPRMRMTMSCDHRVVDGATGARFLQTLTDFIEEPTMMVA